MTDKIKALTVVLEYDMREDEVKGLIAAISRFRNVSAVSPVVADINSHVAEVRAKAELGEKILGVIYPPKFGNLAP